MAGALDFEHLPAAAAKLAVGSWMDLTFICSGLMPIAQTGETAN